MLFDQVNNAIKEAMKAQQKDRLDALRYFKSMLLENKTSKAPVEEMDVLVRHIKKLKDSLENFPVGNELRTKTEKEIEAISIYLPQGLDETEVKKIIQNIIASHPGANMGVVMKELTPQIKGRFDGKRASDLVKEMIASK